jgi:hypothetical protein
MSKRIKEQEEWGTRKYACEASGKVWVHAYRMKDGTFIPGFCRKKPKPVYQEYEKEREFCG